MSMQLYFSPGACSFVPHCMLEQSGAAYEPLMLKLHKGEQNSPAFQAINPRAQVPVLLDGDHVVSQIVAIILHLDAKFPEQSFLPTEPLARTQAIETLAWMNNTVHPTFTHIFLPNKYSDQADVQAQLKVFNTQLYTGLLSELQGLLAAAQAGGSDWFAGAHAGPLDAYALTLTRWGSIAGIDPSAYPALWEHVNRFAQEPAVARVIARERLHLNLYTPGQA